MIKECPYCKGDRLGCDYCDESGLMDLNEIDRAERMLAHEQALIEEDEINVRY